MFIGRVNRLAPSGSSKEEKLRSYDAWMQWNYKATVWLGDVHHVFVSELLLKHFPNKKAQKRAHWVPENMVGEVENVKTPIFLRTKD